LSFFVFFLIGEGLVVGLQLTPGTQAPSGLAVFGDISLVTPRMVRSPTRS
jgi:hypothetical protein